MAFYPPEEFPPGHRLAYDRDGSAFYGWKDDGSPDHPSPSQVHLFNNEEPGSGSFYGNRNIWAVVLPAPVTLIGVFKAIGGTTPRWIEISTDTTDGLDGSWTQVVDDTYNSTSVRQDFRQRIHILNQAGVIGVRVLNDSFQSTTRHLHSLHLYVATQETFLKIWHPTLDQEIEPATLDWGVVYAGEAQTRQFRVKNFRSESAADVSVSTLTHTGAEMDAYNEFSLDGTTFARPLNIGTIGPGAISPVITQRLSLPETATVTTYASQISAIPASWSA